MVKGSKSKKDKPHLGWREVIDLPELGLKAVRVKVDSGARTSALHADDIEFFTRRGRSYVRFSLELEPRKHKRKVTREFPLIERREVRSSIGVSTHRPVILTTVRIGEEVWPIEITLVNRDLMGFPMLLGRTAIRGRFFIDPGRSFLQTPEKYRVHRTPSSK